MERRPLLVSEVLGHPVRDAQGRPVGRLHDLVARIDGDNPPRLVGLLLRHQRDRLFVPITAVEWLAMPAILMPIPASAQAPFVRGAGEVLLARDIMDSQVISVMEPRIVRVNDVVLVREDDSWQVSGVDIGMRALLWRVLPHTVHRHDGSGRVLPWAQVELFAREVPGGLLPPDHRRLAQLHPTDIARIADAVPRRQATEIVVFLDDALAAETMEEMLDAKRADVIEELEPERAARILDHMAPDVAADVLAALEPDLVDTVLRLMDPTEAADVHALLTYPHNTAGGIMSTDYLMAPRGLRVGETLKHIRPQMEKPAVVPYVYVVDDEEERRLCGGFSLRALLLADPAQTVDHIMDPHHHRVTPDTPARRVARTMAEYNLVALPVIDPAGRLLGVVSVDDALHVILPADLQRRVPRISHR